jgi:hypothetical protein
MKLLFENWRQYLTEEDDISSPQFELAVNTLLKVTTGQDNATRDVVVVKHPDQTVKAYFKSSGVSGGGYKGEWIPFEGWATSERVPKDQTYTDGKQRWIDDINQTDRPYGYYALMAKTYWNQGGAKPPPGTIHAYAAEWINTLDGLSDDQKPEVKHLDVPTGVENNINILGKVNKHLMRLGAIDRAAPVLNVKPSEGRRIQFGMDEKS